MLNEVVATTPTIGSNVEEIVYKNIRFLMWDIGGQESLRPSWSTYYVNTKVLIISTPILLPEIITNMLGWECVGGNIGYR